MSFISCLNCLAVSSVYLLIPVCRCVSPLPQFGVRCLVVDMCISFSWCCLHLTSCLCVCLPVPLCPRVSSDVSFNSRTLCFNVSSVSLPFLVFQLPLVSDFLPLSFRVRVCLLSHCALVLVSMFALVHACCFVHLFSFPDVRVCLILVSRLCSVDVSCFEALFLVVSRQFVSLSRCFPCRNLMSLGMFLSLYVWKCLCLSSFESLVWAFRSVLSLFSYHFSSVCRLTASSVSFSTPLCPRASLFSCLRFRLLYFSFPLISRPLTVFPLL